MQQKSAEAEPAALDIHQHQKADAAHNDHRIGDKVQNNVALVRHQPAPAAQNIKPGVVKGRYGVKNTDPRCLGGGKIPHKARVADGGADPLAHKGYGKNGVDQLDHTGKAVHVQRLAHKAAPAYADGAPGSQRQRNAHRGNAQPADLDQQRQHDLPEQGKGVGSVHNDQPGHADGAGGGEQRIQRGKGLPRLDRAGQQQQPRAQQNDQRKPGGDNAPRRLPLKKVLDRFQN